jgi:hypothetical protein
MSTPTATATRPRSLTSDPSARLPGELGGADRVKFAKTSRLGFRELAPPAEWRVACLLARRRRRRTPLRARLRLAATLAGTQQQARRGPRRGGTGPLGPEAWQNGTGQAARCHTGRHAATGAAGNPPPWYRAAGPGSLAERDGPSGPLPHWQARSDKRGGKPAAVVPRRLARKRHTEGRGGSPAAVVPGRLARKPGRTGRARRPVTTLAGAQQQARRETRRRRTAPPGPEATH